MLDALRAHYISSTSPLADYLTAVDDDGCAVQPYWSLPQRSDEWIAARLHRMTGSRVGVAMGCFDGPRVSETARETQREQLFLKMAGLVDASYGMPDPDSFPGRRIQYGVDHEPDAAQAFRHHWTTTHDGALCRVREIGMIVRPGEQWMAASVDGVDEQLTYITEYKCHMGGSPHREPAVYHRFQCAWNVMTVDVNTLTTAHWLSWASNDYRAEELCISAFDRHTLYMAMRCAYAEYLDFCQDRDVEVPVDIRRSFGPNR